MDSRPAPHQSNVNPLLSASKNHCALHQHPSHQQLHVSHLDSHSTNSPHPQAFQNTNTSHQHVLHLHPNNVGHRRSTNKASKVPSASASHKHQTPPVHAERTSGVTAVPLQPSGTKKTSHLQYSRPPMQVLPGSNTTKIAVSSPFTDLAKSGKVCASCGCARESRIMASVSGEKGAASDDIYDEPSLCVTSDKGKPLSEMIISDGYIRLRTAEKSEKSKRDLQSLLKQPEIPVATEKFVVTEKPVATEKPIVTDVKLVPRHQTYETRSKLRGSKSTNAIDRVDLLLDTDDDSLTHRLASLRSSFVDPNGPPTRCSVFIELGEYQTLLKHSRRDSERVYSLPQPQCYGEDTLRAVRLITEKYDTFQRQQQRAMSFRNAVPLAAIKISDRRSVAADGEDLKGLRATAGPAKEDSACEEANGNTAATNCVPMKAVSLTDLKKPSDLLLINDDSDYPVSTYPAQLDQKQLETALLRDYFTVQNDSEKAAFADGGISQLDRFRIEMFYRSRNTCVFVCSSLADVFARACAQDDTARPWIHLHTGVPVWLLNLGSALRRRELILVIAERETGFPLWQDKINYMSNYRELDSANVHTVSVSGSLSKTVKLKIFGEASAKAFLASYRGVTGDPDDDLWRISEDCDRKNYQRCRKFEGKMRERSRHKVKFEKSSISQPCNFVHVTRVDPREANFRAAFADLLPLSDGRLEVGHADSETQTLKSASVTNCATEYRPRLPTS